MLNNFFVYEPKYTNFFSPNVGGMVVDKLRFRFSTCGSILYGENCMTLSSTVFD